MPIELSDYKAKQIKLVTLVAFGGDTETTDGLLALARAVSARLK